MKLLSTVRLVLCLGLLALVSISAQAATIKLNYQHNLGSGTPNGYITGVNSRVYAGEFDFLTSDNTTDIVEWDSGLSAFCIQIDTTLKSTTTEYSVASGLGAFNSTSQGVLIDRLFSSYYETSKSSQVGSAALQLALWEIINETGPSLSLGNGSFRGIFFGTATSLANSWLNSLDETAASGLYNFHTLTAGNSQNLITVTHRVSEPAPLILLSVGLLALYRVRRLALKK